MKKPIKSRIRQSSLKIYFSFVLALVLTVHEFTQSYCLNSFTKTYLTCVPRTTDLDSSPYRSVLPSSPSQESEENRTKQRTELTLHDKWDGHWYTQLFTQNLNRI